MNTLNKLHLRILLTLVCTSCAVTSCNSENPPSGSTTDIDKSYNIPISQLSNRDPFIYVDHDNERYYTVYPTYAPNGIPAGLIGYESKDLKNWKKIGMVWEPSVTFAGNADCWAPDMYEYKGSNYIFVTFSRVKDISNTSHWNRDNFEIKPGTTLLKSTDGPAGPYKEMLKSPELNYTPSDWMCIDGSFFVDKDGQPWMIYSGELCEFYDGRVYAQRMRKDMSGLEGEPILLFSASQAPWVKDSGAMDGNVVFVTDAPFIWQDEESGNLIMIWSSKGPNGYAIGQAISANGKIEGPWVHETEALNSIPGGHAMIFEDLEGKLKISYHSEIGTRTAMTIRDITIKDGKIQKIN